VHGYRVDDFGAGDRALGSFTFFFVADLALKYVFKFFPSDRNGRYLTLHVLCNGFVTFVHFDDVVRSCKRTPFRSLLIAASRARALSRLVLPPVWSDRDWHEGYQAADCDTRGVAVIYALHLYHIAFFQPLPMMDWIHHMVN
jgi:hypothetical protein